MKNKILILDTYGLIYKTYYAFYSNPLLTSSGKNISCVYGVFNSICQLIEKIKPNGIIAALDSIGPTFRHEIYPEYKANREKTPEDLHEQIPIIEELLNVLQVKVLRCNGYEADDIIATIATKHKSQENDIYIFSSDKDLFQLVNDSVFIIKSDKEKSMRIVKRNDVYKIWGVYPEQILDLLSFVGDTSDNVKGVKGIGIKTAQKLINDYQSADILFKDIENNQALSTSTKKKLIEGREDFFNAKKLITLCQDVPIDLNYDFNDFHFEMLSKKLTEYQMPSLSKKFLALANKDSSSTEAKVVNFIDEKDNKKYDDNSNIILSPLKKLCLSFKESLNTPVELILTKEELDTVIKKLSTVKEVSCFFDFDSKKFFTFLGDVVYEVAFTESLGGDLLLEDLSILNFKNFFNKKDITFIFHDAKPILKYLKSKKVISEYKLTIFDTSIASWILDSSLLNYSIKDIAKLCNCDFTSEKLNQEFAMFTVFIFKLKKDLEKCLKENDMLEIFNKIETPLIPILCEMEDEGIYLDVHELKELSKSIENEIEINEKEIYKIADHEFNIASPKQLQTVLFEERKLKPLKKIKTGYSTDDESLESLIEDDEIIVPILNYRKLKKINSSYVVSLPKLVDSNSFIHTTFLQTGTATGRLSSKDPNLQNIPIREELGRKIRHSFYANNNSFLLSADYSQIELMVLAHISGDKALHDAFNNGDDIHAKTASLIFSVSKDDVTPQMRRVAKVINFGVIYGMSAFRLSNELKIPRKQASSFIETYFSNYSGVADYIEKTKKFCFDNGYVQTITGRRRYIPEIKNKNKIIKSQAERIAINTPIQGTASEIVKLAMLKVNDEIKKQKLSSKLILQVHDELIFTVPKSEIELIIPLVKSSLEKVIYLSVPLRVSIEYGASWGDLH